MTELNWTESLDFCGIQVRHDLKLKLETPVPTHPWVLMERRYGPTANRTESPVGSLKPGEGMAGGLARAGTLE